nr:retrotransposon protein, putative, Ty1-copia subclass [Tanacetum cinerariifolium]
MLQELKSMFKKQAGVERFDLIQTCHACKQEEEKLVGAYVLNMKGFMKQLERLGYVLLQGLSVGLILNGLTGDFARFVRNYNMHNMEKTIGELHALLIEYEKGLPKKAATPHVMAIHVSKNNALYFNAIPCDGIYEIDMINLVPNANSIYSVSNKRAKHNLDLTYLWHCHLAHISKKRIEKLQHDGLLKSTDDESFDQYVSCLSGRMTRKPFLHRTKRATDLLGLLHTDVCGPLKHVSRQGANFIITFTDDYSHYGYVILLKHKHEVFETFKSATRIFNMVLTKKVDKTPYELWYGKVPNLSYLKDIKETMGYYFYFPPKNEIVVARYAEFLEKNLLSKKVSGMARELKEIQDEDALPFENTGEIPMEVEGFEPPQKEAIPVCRMDNSKRGNIPMQERLDLNKTQGASTPEEVKSMQNVPYALAIGSIMYAECYENEFDGADEFNENPLAKNYDKRLEKQSSDAPRKNLWFKLDTSSGKDVVSDDVSDGEDEIWVTREKLNGKYKPGIGKMKEITRKIGECSGSGCWNLVVGFASYMLEIRKPIGTHALNT